ncbi:MAG: hypothetical protein LBS74_08095, partial [Oscillospiraceae bacterium]|nr:hypothetical protein [Oscillospiraceae bacterium]
MELSKLDSHIFSKYPTRFKRDEKDSFLIFIAGVFKQNGYAEKDIKIRKMKDTVENNNLIVGEPNAKYLFTAHYDTPGRTGFFSLGSKLWGRTIGMGLALILGVLLALSFFFISRYIPHFTDLSFFQRYIYSLLWVLILVIAFVCVPMSLKNKNNRNDNSSGVLALLKIAELVSSDKELKA